MVVLRSRKEAESAPILVEVLDRLHGADPLEIREEFRKIRAHFKDDVESVVGFWLNEAVVRYDPAHRKTHKKILMWLFDFAGLRHPLIRALLNRFDTETLAKVGVVKSGDSYKFKLGEAL
jgi:hypothetical protein